jgi:hypothetical protein
MNRCECCRQEFDELEYGVCEECKYDMEIHSNCCNAKIYEDTDICSDCHEHCDTTWNEWKESWSECCENAEEFRKKREIDIAVEEMNLQLRKSVL